MGSVESRYDFIELPVMDETYLQVSLEDQEKDDGFYDIYFEVESIPEYLSDHIQNQNSLIPSRDINGLLEEETE